MWDEMTDEGNRQRQSPKTRNLQTALKKLAELETNGPAPVKKLKLVSEAIADFLANKKPELEPVTYQKYVQRLGLLQEHCNKQGIQDLPNISPALLNSYKLKRCEVLSSLTWSKELD